MANGCIESVYFNFGQHFDIYIPCTILQHTMHYMLHIVHFELFIADYVLQNSYHTRNFQLVFTIILNPYNI